MKRLNVFDKYKTPSQWKERALKMDFNKKEKVKVTRPYARVAVAFAAVVIVGGGVIGYGLTANNNDNSIQNAPSASSSAVQNNSKEKLSGRIKGVTGLSVYPVTAKIISVKGDEVKANWFGEEITLNIKNTKFVNENYSCSLLEEGDMISFDYKKNGDIYEPQTMLAYPKKLTAISSTVNRVEGNKIYFHLFGRERFINADAMNLRINTDEEGIKSCKLSEVRDGNVITFLAATSNIGISGGNEEILPVTLPVAAEFESNVYNQAIYSGLLFEENLSGEMFKKSFMSAANVKKIENNIVTVSIDGEDYSFDRSKTDIEAEKITVGEEITVAFSADGDIKDHILDADTIRVSEKNEIYKNLQQIYNNAIVKFERYDGKDMIVKCGEKTLKLDISNAAYDGADILNKQEQPTIKFKKGEELYIVFVVPDAVNCGKGMKIKTVAIIRTNN